MPNMPTLYDFIKGDRKITSKREILQALRVAIISELEARYIYEGLAEAVEDPVLAVTFRDISKEEGIHIGELKRLAKYLGNKENDIDNLLNEGAQEVEDTLETLDVDGKV